MRNKLAGVLACAAIAGCATPAAEERTRERTASADAITVINHGFESSNTTRAGDPEGWVSIQHAGLRSYAFVVDAETRRSGAKSLRIDYIGSEPFGSILQQVNALPWQGRTVRLSGWLKTKGVTGSPAGHGAALTLNAMRAGSILAHDHMTATPLVGTNDWTYREITLAIPPGTEKVEVGAMLQGPGTLWLDDVELAVLPR